MEASGWGGGVGVDGSPALHVISPTMIVFTVIVLPGKEAAYDLGPAVDLRRWKVGGWGGGKGYVSGGGGGPQAKQEYRARLSCHLSRAPSDVTYYVQTTLVIVKVVPGSSRITLHRVTSHSKPIPKADGGKLPCRSKPPYRKGYPAAPLPCRRPVRALLPC